MVHKIAKKNTFLSSLFQMLKKAWQKRVFSILRTASIVKLLSKILHGYYPTLVFLQFWKKLIDSSKLAKQVRMLYFFRPSNNSLTIEKKTCYGKIMSLCLPSLCNSYPHPDANFQKSWIGVVSFWFTWKSSWKCPESIAWGSGERSSLIKFLRSFLVN